MAAGYQRDALIGVLPMSQGVFSRPSKVVAHEIQVLAEEDVARTISELDMDVGKRYPR